MKRLFVCTTTMHVQDVHAPVGAVTTMEKTQIYAHAMNRTAIIPYISFIARMSMIMASLGTGGR